MTFWSLSAPPPTLFGDLSPLGRGAPSLSLRFCRDRAGILTFCRKQSLSDLSKSYLSETAKLNGLPIVYGDPGAGLQLVSVTVNTNNFPADRLTAYK